MSWRQRSTIARSSLRDGMRITDSGDNHIYRWRDSWHESDTLFFTASALKSCDTCDRYFTKGELVSKGFRQIYPDAPLPVEGEDFVHLACDDCYKSMNISDILKGRNVTTFGNFSTLSQEDKIKWLTEAGQDIGLAEEKLPLEGFKFVVTGNFSNKDHLLSLIASSGGSVAPSLTKACTHCLLGRAGTTDYGQTTGPGSKKHKEAKKAKLVMVEDLEKFIEERKAFLEAAALAVPEAKEPEPEAAIAPPVKKEKKVSAKKAAAVKVEPIAQAETKGSESANEEEAPTAAKKKAPERASARRSSARSAASAEPKTVATKATKPVKAAAAPKKSAVPKAVGGKTTRKK